MQLLILKHSVHLPPDTVELELSPIQESIRARDSSRLSFYSSADSNGIYQFKLPRLYQDYSYTAVVRAEHFWEAWEQVSSVPETIYVTDRPDFESFEIIIKPISIHPGNRAIHIIISKNQYKMIMHESE